MYHATVTEVILQGDVAGTRQYLETDIDLEALDEYGFTPLIEAVIGGHLEIVRLLLEKGVEVNTQDATGRTALHWAVDNHQLTICQLLLEHKADPNAYTHAGQSVLVFPYLRAQKDLKVLLYGYQGKLSFAQDFIQVKLLGHRYELRGQADIIDPHGQFVAIDYEGFFLEFVIEIVRHSLENYCKHFRARAYRADFEKLKTIIELFKRASLLLQYQKYTVDIQQVADTIDELLETELLFLPIAYEGHAVSFVQYKNLLVRCDRGANSEKEGSIVVYHMQYTERWTKPFIKKLLYERQSETFMTEGIQAFLGLKRIANIPITAQLIGNCSWANIEASVLVMLYLLNHSEALQQRSGEYQDVATIQLYESWVLWDKKRALEECIKSFGYASPARKATIAMLAGAVLFQACDYQKAEDVNVARKLMPILRVPEYQYILRSYLKIYWQESKTQEGHHLVQLLNMVGVRPMFNKDWEFSSS